ncbi:hypothetical protein J6TS1_00990 [Siminovitchia terrae]|nr:hypothetical protein J22TS1_13110 [Siminovitchia terrae]GIN94229.1 hypothetical protein J6TS1_00990 [Siminovitchia terrae]
MYSIAGDVVTVSDGGGKVPAAIHPIMSRDRVVRFLFGLLQQASANGEDLVVQLVPLYGKTGIVVRSDGHILVVTFIHANKGIGNNLYFVRNPKKLEGI